MRRLLFRFVISALVLACLWACGLLWFISSIPSEPFKPTHHYDAVVVLTGGADRIDHGLQRVKHGDAGQIFISGVNDEATAEHIIQKAIERDNAYVEMEDSNQLALGYDATSTIGNALEVKKWIEKHHIRTILLVTANYHMPRSLLEFHFVMPKDLHITPDPVFPKGFSTSHWWQMGNSSRLILMEYHKSIAAYLRHELILWHKA